MSGGVSGPVKPRAWLQGVVAANQRALERFLCSEMDLREELLDIAFPYQSGPLPPQLDGIAALALLHWAETTSAGFWFLRKVMGRLVRSGEPVPEAWRDLHAGILDGTATEPSGKKGRPSVNDRRDELIALFVTILQVQFALPRLANALNRNGESAIEIVHDELKGLCLSCGFQMPAPDSIEKAVGRRENARLADPIIGVIDNQT
jgi:hypothetical protein